MLPELFSLGPIHVYSYGLMFALGVLMAVFYLGKQTPVGGLTQNKIIDLILILTFVGIVGGRLFYIGQHWDYYLENPSEVFAVWEGGLVIYGGIIAALIGLAIFCRVRRVNFFLLTDLYFPAVALAQAFGRVGCFLNGCCWGSPTHLPWAVQFPFLKDPVHPTQIYSSLFNFGLFAFLALRYQRRVFVGEITLYYLLLYSLGRFIVEYLRGDNLPILWGMTSAQVISVGVAVIALGLYFGYLRGQVSRPDPFLK